MNCLLYQLRFNTSVHFGGSDSALSLYSSEDHFRADTLFSALCHTALQLEGSSGLEKLISLTKADGLLLSDSMPWSGDCFYLPKPFFTAQTTQELPAEKRKAIKKLAWIPADRFGEYCDALRTGVFFESEGVSFGNSSEITKAMVPDQGDARPYPVGLYQFRENCGLYFLAMCGKPDDAKWLSSLVEALGITGIGGKISAGYGKFTVMNQIDLSCASHPGLVGLYRALTGTETKAVLLTTSLPRDEELDRALDGAGYQLVRRSGFVASDTYAESPRKKQTQHYLAAGSVVQNRFSGDVYEIGTYGNHPVYRYSKPLFLGVNL